MTYYTYLTFSVDSTTKVSAVSQLPDDEDSGPPSGSAKKLRRKSNLDGLQLTTSGRVSVSSNEVNIKFDSSYRNSENTVTLLGRSLTLGQACRIISVALYGPEIPLEDSGI